MYSTRPCEQPFMKSVMEVPSLRVVQTTGIARVGCPLAKALPSLHASKNLHAEYPPQAATRVLHR